MGKRISVGKNNKYICCPLVAPHTGEEEGGTLPQTGSKRDKQNNQAKNHTWDLRERTGTDILSGWKELRCSRLLEDTSWFQSFSSPTDLVILIEGSFELNAKWVTVAAMADIWKWRQCRQCITTVQHHRWIMVTMIKWDMEWWFVDFFSLFRLVQNIIPSQRGNCYNYPVFFKVCSKFLLKSLPSIIQLPWTKATPSR